jgi:hypothetical protein
MNFSLHSIKYATATLCVVLLTVALHFIFFSHQASLKKEDSKEKVNRPTQTEKEYSNKPKLSNSEIQSKTIVKEFAFTQISLPAPPVDFSRKQGEENSASIKSTTALIEKESKQNQIKTADIEKAQNKVESKSAIQLELAIANKNAKLYAMTSAKEAITKRIDQLASLKGSERALFFPPSSTVQILAYMHNCIGIDVGAIDNNSNLTVFSKKNQQHSQIVRVANGYKTDQEQALLALYSPHQTLVRLYPKSFDEALGKMIDNYLGSATLTQLSGQYALKGNSLWLREISINHQGVLQDWQLSKTC